MLQCETQKPAYRWYNLLTDVIKNNLKCFEGAGDLLQDWRVFPLELKDTALIPFPVQVQPHPNTQPTPTFYRWAVSPKHLCCSGVV